MEENEVKEHGDCNRRNDVGQEINALKDVFADLRGNGVDQRRHNKADDQVDDDAEKRHIQRVAGGVPEHRVGQNPLKVLKARPGCRNTVRILEAVDNHLDHRVHNED